MAENPLQELDAIKRSTQAGKLMEIAKQAEYWHTPQKKAYATLNLQGHKESHAVEDALFRDWLVHAYYREHGHGPNSTSLKNVLTLLTARATQAGKQYDAHMRVAENDGDIFIDLGDPDWRAIHVGRSGWTVEQSAPVRFVRAQGTKAMPVPSPDGNIEDLFGMVNVQGEDLPLLTGWLLGALYPRGPYPILLLQGPPGAAKSTLARTLKSLVDPNDLELRAAPKDMRDLQIAALHSRCVALDNLPHVPQELSDTLCRLSTGEATSSRTLYTNTGETVVKVQCPVIVTGIGAIASQADLLDRAIILGLHVIPGSNRIPESEYWQSWETRKASVLGALLDAMVHGLRNRDVVRLDRLPRMADFAKWAISCEPVMWQSGTFLAAYDQNRSDAREITLDADPVGHAIVEMMKTREQWSGTAADLLTSLELTAGDKTRELQNWPKAPHILSRRLARIEGVLAETGISVDAQRASGRDRTRLIVIARKSDASDASDASIPGQSTDFNGEMSDASDAKKSSVRSSVRRSNAGAERVSGLSDASDANPLNFNTQVLEREKEVKGVASDSVLASDTAKPDATDGILSDGTTNNLYAYIGQTVYTAEGAAQLVQVFGGRVAVQYPGRDKVTYLSPGQVVIDEMLL